GSLAPTDLLEGSLASTDLLEGSLAPTDLLEGSLASTDLLEGSLVPTDLLEGVLAPVDILKEGTTPREQEPSSGDPQSVLDVGHLGETNSLGQLDKPAKEIILTDSLAETLTDVEPQEHPGACIDVREDSVPSAIDVVLPLITVKESLIPGQLDVSDSNLTEEGLTQPHEIVDEMDDPTFKSREEISTLLSGAETTDLFPVKPSLPQSPRESSDGLPQEQVVYSVTELESKSGKQTLIPGVVVQSATPESDLEDNNITPESDDLPVEDIVSDSNTYVCLQDDITLDLLNGQQPYDDTSEDIGVLDPQREGALDPPAAGSINIPVCFDELQKREPDLMSLSFEKAGDESCSHPEDLLGYLGEKTNVLIHLPEEIDDPTPDILDEKAVNLEEHSGSPWLVYTAISDYIRSRSPSPLSMFFGNNPSPEEYSDEEEPGLTDRQQSLTVNQQQESTQERETIPGDSSGEHLILIDNFTTDDVASDGKLPQTVNISGEMKKDIISLSRTSIYGLDVTLNRFIQPPTSLFLSRGNLPTSDVKTPQDEPSEQDSSDTITSPTYETATEHLPSSPVSPEPPVITTSLADTTPDYEDTTVFPSDSYRGSRDDMAGVISEKSVKKNLLVVEISSSLAADNTNTRDETNLISIVPVDHTEEPTTLDTLLQEENSSGKLSTLTAETTKQEGALKNLPVNKKSSGETAEGLYESVTHFRVEEQAVDESDESDYSFGTEDCGDVLVPQEYIDTQLNALRKAHEQEKNKENVPAGTTATEDDDTHKINLKISHPVRTSSGDGTKVEGEAGLSYPGHTEPKIYVSGVADQQMTDTLTQKDLLGTSAKEQTCSTEAEGDSQSSTTPLRVEEQPAGDTDDSDYMFSTEDSGDVYCVPQRYIYEQLVARQREQTQENIPSGSNTSGSNNINLQPKTFHPWQTRTPWSSVNQDSFDDEKEDLATLLDSVELSRRISEVHRKLQNPEDASQEIHLEQVQDQRVLHNMKDSCKNPGNDLVTDILSKSSSVIKDSSQLSSQAVNMTTRPAEPYDATSHESESDSDDDMRVGPIKGCHPLVIPLSPSPSKSPVTASDSDSSQSESDVTTDEDDIEIPGTKPRAKYNKPARSHRSKLHTIPELSEDEEEEEEVPTRPPRLRRLSSGRFRLLESWNPDSPRGGPPSPKVGQRAPKVGKLAPDFLRRFEIVDEQVFTSRITEESDGHGQDQRGQEKSVFRQREARSSDSATSSSSSDSEEDDDGEPNITYGRRSHVGSMYKRAQAGELDVDSNKGQIKSEHKEQESSDEEKSDEFNALNRDYPEGPEAFKTRNTLKTQRDKSPAEPDAEHTSKKETPAEAPESSDINITGEHEVQNIPGEESASFETNLKTLQPPHSQKGTSSTPHFLEEDVTQGSFYPPMETLLIPAHVDPIIVGSPSFEEDPDPSMCGEVTSQPKYVITALGRESVLTHHAFVPPMEMLLIPELQAVGDEDLTECQAPYQSSVTSGNDSGQGEDEFGMNAESQARDTTFKCDSSFLPSIEHRNFVGITDAEAHSLIVAPEVHSSLSAAPHTSSTGFLQTDSQSTVSAEEPTKHILLTQSLNVELSRDTVDTTTVKFEENSSLTETVSVKEVVVPKHTEDLSEKQTVCKDHSRDSKMDEIEEDNNGKVETAAAGDVGQETVSDKTPDEADGDSSLCKDTKTTDEVSEGQTDEGTIGDRQPDESSISHDNVVLTKEQLTFFQSGGLQRLACSFGVIDPTETVLVKGEIHSTVSGESSPVLDVDLTHSTSNVDPHPLTTNSPHLHDDDHKDTLSSDKKSSREPEISTQYFCNIHPKVKTPCRGEYQDETYTEDVFDDQSDVFPATSDTFAVTASSDPFSMFSDIGSWTGDPFSDENTEISSYRMSETLHVVQEVKGSPSIEGGDGGEVSPSQGDAEKPDFIVCPPVLSQTLCEKSVAKVESRYVTENSDEDQSSRGCSVMDEDLSDSVPVIHWDTFPLASDVSPGGGKLTCDLLVATDAPETTATCHGDTTVTCKFFDALLTGHGNKETQNSEESSAILSFVNGEASEKTRGVCDAQVDTTRVNEETEDLDVSWTKGEDQLKSTSVSHDPNVFVNTTVTGKVLISPDELEQSVDLNTNKSRGLTPGEALHLPSLPATEQVASDDVTLTEEQRLVDIRGVSLSSQVLTPQSQPFEECVPTIDLLGLGAGHFTSPRGVKTTSEVRLLDLDSPDGRCSRGLSELEGEVCGSQQDGDLTFFMGESVEFLIDSDIPDSSHSSAIQPQLLPAGSQVGVEVVVVQEDVEEVSEDEVVTQENVEEAVTQENVPTVITQVKTEYNNESMGRRRTVSERTTPTLQPNAAVVIAEDFRVINSSSEDKEPYKSLYSLQTAAKAGGGDTSSPVTQTDAQNAVDGRETTLHLREASQGHDLVCHNETGQTADLLTAIPPSPAGVVVDGQHWDEREGEKRKQEKKDREQTQESAEIGDGSPRENPLQTIPIDDVTAPVNRPGGSLVKQTENVNTYAVSQLLQVLDSSPGECLGARVKATQDAATLSAEDAASNVRKDPLDEVELTSPAGDCDSVIVVKENCFIETDVIGKGLGICTEEVYNSDSPAVTAREDQYDTDSLGGSESHCDKESTLSEISSDIFESAREPCLPVDPVLVHKLSLLESETPQCLSDVSSASPEPFRGSPETGHSTPNVNASDVTLSARDLSNDAEDHEDSLSSDRTNVVLSEFQQMLDEEDSVSSTVTESGHNSTAEDLVDDSGLSGCDNATGRWVSEGSTASETRLSLYMKRFSDKLEDRIDDSTESQSHRSLLEEIHGFRTYSSTSSSIDETPPKADARYDGGRVQVDAQPSTDLVTSRKQFWDSIIAGNAGGGEPRMSSSSESTDIISQSGDLSKCDTIAEENEHTISRSLSLEEDQVFENSPKEDAPLGLVGRMKASWTDLSSHTDILAEEHNVEEPERATDSVPEDNIETGLVQYKKQMWQNLVDSSELKTESILKNRGRSQKIEDNDQNISKQKVDKLDTFECDEKACVDDEFLSAQETKNDSQTKVLSEICIKDESVCPRGADENNQKSVIENKGEDEELKSENAEGLERVPSYKKIEKGLVKTGKELWESKQTEQTVKSHLHKANNTITQIPEGKKDSKCHENSDRVRGDKDKQEVLAVGTYKQLSQGSNTERMKGEAVKDTVCEEQKREKSGGDCVPVDRRPSIKMIEKGIVQTRKNQWERQLPVMEEDACEDDTSPSEKVPENDDTHTQVHTPDTERKVSPCRRRKFRRPPKSKQAVGYRLSVRIKNGTVVDTKLLWEAREEARKKTAEAEWTRLHAGKNTEDAQVASEGYQNEVTFPIDSQDTVAGAEEPLVIVPPQSSEGVDARDVVRYDEPLAEPDIEEGLVNTTRQVWLNLVTSDNLNTESVLKSKVRAQKNKKGPKLRESEEGSAEESVKSRQLSVRISEGAVLEEKMKWESTMQLPEVPDDYREWKKSRHIQKETEASLAVDHEHVPTALKSSQEKTVDGAAILEKEEDKKLLARIPSIEQIQKGRVLAGKELWEGDDVGTQDIMSSTTHTYYPETSQVPVGVTPVTADINISGRDKTEDVNPIERISSLKFIEKGRVKCGRDLWEGRHAEEGNSKSNDESVTAIVADVSLAADDIPSGENLLLDKSEVLCSDSENYELSETESALQIEVGFVSSSRKAWEERHQESEAVHCTQHMRHAKSELEGEDLENNETENLEDLPRTQKVGSEKRPKIWEFQFSSTEVEHCSETVSIPETILSEDETGEDPDKVRTFSSTAYEGSVQLKRNTWEENVPRGENVRQWKLNAKLVLPTHNAMMCEDSETVKTNFQSSPEEELSVKIEDEEKPLLGSHPEEDIAALTRPLSVTILSGSVSTACHFWEHKQDEATHTQAGDEESVDGCQQDRTQSDIMMEEQTHILDSYPEPKGSASPVDDVLKGSKRAFYDTMLSTDDLGWEEPLAVSQDSRLSDKNHKEFIKSETEKERNQKREEEKDNNKVKDVIKGDDDDPPALPIVSPPQLPDRSMTEQCESEICTWTQKLPPGCSGIVEDDVESFSQIPEVPLTEILEALSPKEVPEGSFLDEISGVSSLYQDPEITSPEEIPEVSSPDELPEAFSLDVSSPEILPTVSFPDFRGVSPHRETQTLQTLSEDQDLLVVQEGTEELEMWVDAPEILSPKQPEGHGQLAISIKASPGSRPSTNNPITQKKTFWDSMNTEKGQGEVKEGKVILVSEKMKSERKQERKENREATQEKSEDTLPPSETSKADACSEPTRVTSDSAPSKDLVSQKKEFWDQLFVKKEVENVKINQSQTWTSTIQASKTTFGLPVNQQEKVVECESSEQDTRLTITDINSKLPSADPNLVTTSPDAEGEQKVPCISEEEPEKNLVAQKKGFWDEYIAKREQDFREDRTHTAKKHAIAVRKYTLKERLSEKNEENESNIEVVESKTSLGRTLSITIKKGTVRASREKYTTQEEDDYTKWKKTRAQKRRKPAGGSHVGSPRRKEFVIQSGKMKSETQAVDSLGKSKRLKSFKKSWTPSSRLRDDSSEEEDHSPPRVRRKTSVKIQKGLVQKYKTHWETTRTKTGFWTWKRQRISSPMLRQTSSSPTHRKFTQTPMIVKTSTGYPDAQFRNQLSPSHILDKVQSLPKANVHQGRGPHSHQEPPSAYGKNIGLPVQKGRDFWEQERYRTPSPPPDIPERPLTPEEAQHYLSGFKGKVAERRKRFDSLGSAISTESLDSIESVEHKLESDDNQSAVALEEEYVSSVLGKVNRQRNLWETRMQKTIQKETEERLKLQPKNKNSLNYKQARGTTPDMLPPPIIRVVTEEQFNDISPVAATPSHRGKETLLYILHNTIEGELVLKTYNEHYMNLQGVPPSITYGQKTPEGNISKFQASNREMLDERPQPARRSKRQQKQRQSSEGKCTHDTSRVPRKSDADQLVATASTVQAAKTGVTSIPQWIVSEHVQTLTQSLSTQQPESSTGSSQSLSPVRSDEEDTKDFSVRDANKTCDIDDYYVEYKRSFATACRLFETELREGEPEAKTATKSCRVGSSVVPQPGVNPHCIERATTPLGQTMNYSDDSTMSSPRGVKSAPSVNPLSTHDATPGLQEQLPDPSSGRSSTLGVSPLDNEFIALIQTDDISKYANNQWIEKQEPNITKKNIKHKSHLIDHGCQTDDELEDFMPSRTRVYFVNRGCQSSPEDDVDKFRTKETSSPCDREIQVSQEDLINPLKRRVSQRSRQYDLLEMPELKRRVYRRRHGSLALSRKRSLSTSDAHLVQEQQQMVLGASGTVNDAGADQGWSGDPWVNMVKSGKFGIANPSSLVASLQDLAKDLPSVYPEGHHDPLNHDDLADLDPDDFQHFPQEEVRLQRPWGC
ncbi:hypothetical protein Hamer_G008882, partial [Homarus americanus]